MKIKNYIFIFFVLVLGYSSCDSDEEEELNVVPPRDRAEQYLVEIDSIERYLSTHFYNYEEFQADPTSSTFQIEIDTIAGLNSDKTPLIDQVDFKIIEDSEEVKYKLYYLKVREGEGEQPTFADAAYLTYKGNMINDEDVFDSKVTPVWLPLYSSVKGFREAMVEFKGYSSFDDNGDGTFTYHDFGIGAMFVPSGLGYFNNPPIGIRGYSPLVFTFQLINANQADDDNDGVLNINEDLDGDREVGNDDTDGDQTANFLDIDDDGDGVLTKHEDLEPDADLEVDRDNDGDPTNDFGDGDPTNDDSDNDGIPNYLDADSIESNQDM